jgi:putative transposase
MTKHTTILAGLLRHLSRSDFGKAVNKHQADKGVRTLPTFDFFKQMVYGQLAGCFSVREIANSLLANRSRLYHAGLLPLKRSTFCDAMEKRDRHVFEDVFHAAVDKAQMIAGKTKKLFEEPLRIIDASIISVCLAKYDRAAYRKAKGAVKLHLNLDGDTLMPYDAYLSCGKVHDIHGMAELCDETDVPIRLTGTKTKKRYPKPIRKIKYYDKEYHHTYEFITNKMEIAAQEIADIYKRRWQVELFFKWIKQNLKIKSFWGTGENAVFSQIWVALIISVLLWICKTIDGVPASAHQILQMIKTILLTKGSIVELCTTKPPPPEIASLQPLPEGLL